MSKLGSLIKQTVAIWVVQQSVECFCWLEEWNVHPEGSAYRGGARAEMHVYIAAGLKRSGGGLLDCVVAINVFQLLLWWTGGLWGGVLQQLFCRPDWLAYVVLIGQPTDAISEFWAWAYRKLRLFTYFGGNSGGMSFRDLIAHS
jgi:hypothetical protein